MNEKTLQEVGAVLIDVLRLGPRPDLLRAETRLLGSLPEFDSMAVVSVVAALEESFDITMDDDDIRGETFETVGSVAALVERKTSG
jgi:acyl carrier protein